MSEKKKVVFLNNTVRLFLIGGLLFIFFFTSTKTVSASSLILSPTTGVYTVGDSFTVGVYVNSSSAAMNAASGVVSFPADKLEIVTISRNGSIFSLWVQEPSFSNTNGTINFEGIVLNPGFTGTNGKIFSIVFKAKAAGTVSVKFASGSILANDGQGSDILQDLGLAQFTFNTINKTTTESLPKTETVSAPAPATIPSSAPTAAATKTTGNPLLPEISSPTNPDQERWYSNSNPKFVWNLPSGVTAVRILYDKNPDSAPFVLYSNPPIKEKQLQNIKDGVWYFHVQFKNASGWGPAAHFRFQIDTVPPVAFQIKFIDTDETTNPRPTTIFNTVDNLSGIDYYKIKIGEGAFLSLAEDKIKSNPYSLPPQLPGEHNILVQAFDRAGNYSAANSQFKIESIEPPVINYYPEILKSGEDLIVKGETKYPASVVTVFWQKEGEGSHHQDVTVDSEGKFTLITEEKPKSGTHSLWAVVTNKVGAKSNPTEKVSFSVLPPALVKLGSQAVDILAVVIPLLAMIVVAVFIIWYSYCRFRVFRTKLSQEVGEAESALHKSFHLLKADLKKYLAILERLRRRGVLSKEDQKAVEGLKKNLSLAEKTISKEIKDIKKVK
jgi:hypothetical protein